MGARDGAGDIVRTLQREYDVSERRARQVANRVRNLVGNPDIEAPVDAGLLEPEFTAALTDDLPGRLDDQDADTIEGRWNALVRSRGIVSVVGDDALLYNPGAGGLDPELALVAQSGETTTITAAMVSAWTEGIRIEAVNDGLRLGETEYRPVDLYQTTFSTLDGFDQDALDDQLSRDLARGRFEVETDLLALTDVEFPADVPREPCVLAVAAARRYLVEHDGATRSEILDALEPENEYPHGLDGAPASATDTSQAFRDWWWADVVAPGLSALGDVEEPGYAAGTWRPTDALRDGFEDEAAVEAVLEDGLLFAVTYRDGGEEREFVGYRDEISRPSARPIDGSPVFRFQPVDGGSAKTIRLPALRALRPRSFERLPASSRETAIATLTGVADETPERIPLQDVEAVLDDVRNDEVAMSPALAIAGRVILERPAVREAIADDLVTLLHDGVDWQSGAGIGVGTAQCAGLVTAYAPARMLDGVPAMAAAAETATGEVRQWLLYAFSAVALDHPEELRPAVPFLVDCFADSEEYLHETAFSTLSTVASGDPEVAGAVAEALAGSLSSSSARRRRWTAILLADAAETNPAAVVERVPALAAALSADDEKTCVRAAEALCHVGEAEPAAVREEHERVVAALEHPNPTVRANACTLLGTIDAPVALDRIQELEDDTDEEVREQAAWALEQLS